MTMFEYFPENYPWSAAVMCAVGMGGELHEINQACRPLKEVSAGGHDPRAVTAWFESWDRVAEALERRAAADLAQGLHLTASEKYMRSAIYHMTAERQAAGDEHAEESYVRTLNTFAAGVEHSASHRVEFVEVPYFESTLPALFVANGRGPAPCLIIFNGTDSTKEMNYLFTYRHAAERGISLLVCDQPGSGAAIRLNGLTSRFDMELAATACVDWLEGRPEIDPNRIGIAGLSLGGYFAPRSAAFEKRLACCIAWGAIWDLPRVVDHLFRSGTSAVPLSVFPRILGCSEAELVQALEPFRLEDVIGLVECPLLVMHGENDRQVPLWAATHTYEGAINARSRTLKVFNGEEGGAEHCQFDLVSNGTAYMFDWVVSTLGNG